MTDRTNERVEWVPAERSRICGCGGSGGCQSRHLGRTRGLIVPRRWLDRGAWVPSERVEFVTYHGSRTTMPAQHGHLWHRRGAHIVPRDETAWRPEYLDDGCHLSNKACPRYYVGPQDCGCPEGRCWYDEQKEARRQGERALAPASWRLLVARDETAEVR